MFLLAGLCQDQSHDPDLGLAQKIYDHPHSGKATDVATPVDQRESSDHRVQDHLIHIVDLGQGLDLHGQSQLRGE